MKKRLLIVILAILVPSFSAFSQISDSYESSDPIGFEDMQMQQKMQEHKDALAEFFKNWQKMQKAEIDKAVLSPETYMDSFTQEVRYLCSGAYVNSLEATAVLYLIQNDLVKDKSKIKDLADRIIEMEKECLEITQADAENDQAKWERGKKNPGLFLNYVGNLIIDFVAGIFVTEDRSVANAIKELGPIQSGIVAQYGLEYLAGKDKQINGGLSRSYTASEVSPGVELFSIEKGSLAYTGDGSSSFNSTISSYQTSYIEGLEILQKLAANEQNDEVAIAAIRTLGNLRDPESVYLLKKMYYEDKTKKYAVLAARATNYAIYQNYPPVLGEDAYDLKVKVNETQKSYLDAVYKHGTEIESNIVAMILGKEIKYPYADLKASANSIVQIIQGSLQTAVPGGGYANSIKTIKMFKDFGTINKIKSMNMVATGIEGSKSISIGSVDAVKIYKYATTIDITKDAALMNNILKSIYSGVGVSKVVGTVNEIIVDNQRRAIYENKLFNDTKTTSTTTTSMDQKVWDNSWSVKVENIEQSLRAAGLTPVQVTEMMTAFGEKASSAPKVINVSLKFIDGSVIGTVVTLSPDKVLTIARTIAGTTTITESYKISEAISEDIMAKAQVASSAEQASSLTREQTAEMNSMMNDYNKNCRD